MSNDDQNLKMVNASGFLFQLRVAKEVHAPASRHGWEVIAEEHRWQDPESGEDGYIDMVVSHSGVHRMVIECKRVTNDGKWIFLIPSDRLYSQGRFQVLWTNKEKPQEDVFAWSDFSVYSPMEQSEFCIVRGQGEKDVPMLERICGGLLQSVERLALQELMETKRESVTRFYIPVIVTNAELVVCRFTSQEVDLTSGQLPQGTFESVPYIRFTKSLPSKIPFFDEARDEITYYKPIQNRTVFVVQSAHITHFLQEMRPRNYESRDQFQTPWITMRRALAARVSPGI